MKWFKFYGQDWLTDLKILGLSMEDRLCYLTLLCLASTSEEKGLIKNCDEDMVIRLANIPNEYLNEINPYELAQGCMDRFVSKGMITNDNAGNVIIVNFVKRQEQNLTGYERIKRFREKQKTLENKPDSIDNSEGVINDNARGDKNRIDKIRKEKRESPHASVKYLTNIPLEDMKEFTQRFEVTDDQIKSKAEDLKLYCERKGRDYKNYKSFLLNALKRDFGEKGKDHHLQGITVLT